MKKFLVILSLLLFVYPALATVATYPGEIEKQGTEATFKFGFASDTPSNLNISVEEPEGLKIDYPSSPEFSPENAPSSVQIGGSQLPVKEYSISVEEIESSGVVYRIPVSVEAVKSSETSQGISSQVLQEREYVFRLVTDTSSESIIDSDNSRRENLSETRETEDEEQKTLILENNSNSSGVEGKKSGPGLSLPLLAGVVLVFSYIIYEAFK
jgi:hypothetical protein